MTATRADRLLGLVSVALAAKLHAEGGDREVAAEELSRLVDDALALRAELVPGVFTEGPCPACGMLPPVRAVDVPEQLIPAGQRFAASVRDYVTNGEQLVDIAYLPVDVAGAVLLLTEAMRQACPGGVDFAEWLAGFLLSWQLATPGASGVVDG